jgi:hypothetical protein
MEIIKGLEVMNSELVDKAKSAKKAKREAIRLYNTCNAAQKARRLLQYEIGGIVFKFDCHHHLHNVWIKGMEKSVSVFLRVVLSDSLEQISPELQVTCIFLAIA